MFVVAECFQKLIRVGNELVGEATGHLRKFPEKLCHESRHVGHLQGPEIFLSLLLLLLFSITFGTLMV